MIQRISLFFFLFFCFQIVFAQKTMRVVKANSDKTYFVEDKNGVKNNWYLDPSIPLDVYEVNKTSKPKWVEFHTDVESFKMKIKPGERYDFIVLLNGKDSCFNQIYSKAPLTQFKELQPATHDTIPFELTKGNNIKIKVLLNGIDSLLLHFDTGATGVVMTHDAIANRSHLLENEKEGFKTQDYQILKTLSTLQIGNFSWDKLPIFPVTLSPKGTDGHFGWDFFEGRILEIDYDKKILIVHSSLPKKPKGYAKMEIEYINTLFCIEGKLKAKGRTFKNRFLFDTGYQRAILLDSVLVQEQAFPKDLPLLKLTELRNGQGKVFRTKIVNADAMKLGKYSLSNIPTQLLDTQNPARFKTNIFGNEFLKRFNTILDFQNNYIYLKPNSLASIPYIDATS